MWSIMKIIFTQEVKHLSWDLGEDLSLYNMQGPQQGAMEFFKWSAFLTCIMQARLGCGSRVNRASSVCMQQQPLINVYLNGNYLHWQDKHWRASQQHVTLSWTLNLIPPHHLCTFTHHQNPPITSALCYNIQFIYLLNIPMANICINLLHQHAW